jgi:hypothetical protein
MTDHHQGGLLRHQLNKDQITALANETKNMRKAMAMAHASSVQNLNPVTYTADRKLHEQFNFFKQEFIKTAMRMDIAIPMDIVEEKSHFLKPFLESNGPKYVFQVLQSHMMEIQIMRPGLSLLVTTLALLKRHIPKNLYDNTNMYYGSPQPLTADEIWASQMVPKITDSITVTGCVSILLAAHHPVIQELLVNVVAGLLSISDDAITQILHTPNILYTQTNKKIPTSEPNREKILAHQFKKLYARFQEMNVPFPGSMMNHEDSRRTNALNSPGGDNTSPVHRQSMNRSNSKLSAGGAGSGGGSGSRKDFGNTNDNNDARNDDPDEFSSCLSYIFSVALMQKSRHLLVAACSDIIISIARQASSSLLCEYVAKVTTSPLPIINITKNTNTHRSLKHLYTNQQQVIEPLHVNPLGAKVIDWAGVKIPLKFLQRYHQIFGNTMSAVNHPSNAHTTTGTPATGSLVRNQQQGGEKSVSSGHGNHKEVPDAQLILSENVKNEYRYAHNRALLAVCSLLISSHEIVVYVVGLQGAMDVIKLSAAIYSDDEMQPSAFSPQGNAANNNNNNNNTPQFNINSSATHSNTRRFLEMHPNLPSVVISAMNALQIEKTHQHRMRAMLNHSNNNSLTGSNGIGERGFNSSRRSSTTLHSKEQIYDPQNPHHHVTMDNHQQIMPKKSTSPDARAASGGRLKPILSATNSSTASKSTPAFTGPSRMVTGSPTIQEHLSQSIPLANQHEVKFSADYAKETEKYNLYIQNQNNSNLIQQSLASPLQYYAAKQLTQQNRGPLHLPNLNQPDQLLNTSLQAIESNIHDSLMQPPKPQQRTPIAALMFGGQQQSQSTLNGGSISLMKTESTTSGIPFMQQGSTATHSNNNNNNNNAEEEPEGRLSRSAGAALGLSASRDFFGSLPGKPAMPRRIEAKDVIIPNEDISRIRKKFQLMGENAINQIKQSGKFCLLEHFKIVFN